MKWQFEEYVVFFLSFQIAICLISCIYTLFCYLYKSLFVYIFFQKKSRKACDLRKLMFGYVFNCCFFPNKNFIAIRMHFFVVQIVSLKHCVINMTYVFFHLNINKRLHRLAFHSHVRVTKKKVTHSNKLQKKFIYN